MPRAVGLLLVGAGLDTDLALAVALGLAVLAETVLDVLARVVFAHPGVDVLHVVGDSLAQAGDLFEEGLHGGSEQLFEHTVIERALLLGEPASGGHGALDIKTIGLLDSERRSEGELQDEQRMLDQEATQLGAIGIAKGRA